jgi:Pectate lyase superfamily protein
MAVIVEFLLSGFTDNSGQPLNGGKVYSYQAGTNTPKSLYTDVSGATAETNPVVLDSNGRKQVYASGAYKLVVKTSAEATLYTFDNLYFGDDVGPTFLGTTSGAANLYVAAPTPAVSSYVDGATFIFQAHQTNTGSSTLNINSLGAKTISVIAGQIQSGNTYLARYKASTDSFVIVNPDPGYATTHAEMSALNTAGVEIVVRQAITLTANLTLTAPLRIEKNGSIVTAGFTLTINGPFEAGLYQVFDAASAQVVFGKGSVDEVYPQWWGAVTDDSTDCTAAINKAIVAANTNIGLVFLPPGIYKTLTPILILYNNFTLRGKSLSSIIHNAGATDIIRIGDDVTALANVRVTSLRTYTDDNAAGWNIRAWKARNTLIDNCQFGGGDVNTGAIRMTESFCSRIVNNSVGGVRGWGFFIDSASNAFSIIGNRLDGHSSRGVRAIHYSSDGATITGNTIETWVDGIKLAAGGAHVCGNYFEDNSGVDIINHSTCEGIVIMGNFHAAPGAGVAGVSFLNINGTINGLVVKGNYSAGTHSSTAYIILPTEYPYPDATYDIGANEVADTNEVIQL